MKVLNTTKVYGDGHHNAFTDLKYYRGYYYLAFRNGLAHISPKSQVKVMRSRDGISWKEMPFPSVDGDVRDCKFGELHGTLLLLIPYRHKRLWWWKFGTLMSKMEKGKWMAPAKLMEDWIAWRPKVLNNNLYLPAFWHGSGMGNFKNWRAGILVDDEKEFEVVYSGGAANEMEVFQHKGCIYGLVRREGQIAVIQGIRGTKDQYTMNNTVQSPVVYPITEDKFLVIGRNTTVIDADPWERVFMPDSCRGFVFKEELAVYILDMDSHQQTFLGNIAGGMKRDCGYAGIVKKGDNYLISYYEGSHGHANIYTAEIKLEPIDLE